MQVRKECDSLSIDKTEIYKQQGIDPSGKKRHFLSPSVALQPKQQDLGQSSWQLTTESEIIFWFMLSTSTHDKNVNIK